MIKRFSLVIAMAMLLLVAAPVAAQPSSGETTTIMGVNENESVYVRLENFPANSTFYVLMNRNGTLGIGGYMVSKVTTNSGGTFIAEFPIPEELAGEDIINIRFENSEGSYDPPYNFFYNSDMAFSPYAWDESDTTYNNLDNGFPTFIFLAVDKGASITVETRYFPAGDRWAVYMKDGALDAEKLYEVNGFDSAEGGIQKMTLTIPSQLQYKEKIAVIFYRINDGFRTYNLVWNRDCAYPDCNYEN